MTYQTPIRHAPRLTRGLQRTGCGHYQFLIRDGVRDSSAVPCLSALSTINMFHLLFLCVGCVFAAESASRRQWDHHSEATQSCHQSHFQPQRTGYPAPTPIGNVPYRSDADLTQPPSAIGVEFLDLDNNSTIVQAFDTHLTTLSVCV